MKTTVDIPDVLFLQAKEVAKRNHVPVKVLMVEGLRWAILEKNNRRPLFKLGKLKSQGGGMTPEFENAGWEKIRDLIYSGE